MSGRGAAGSRFLYDSFDAPVFDATAARVEANERVSEERWAALEYRLKQIEGTLDRVERRMWFSVYGVAAFLLAQGVELLRGTLLK